MGFLKAITFITLWILLSFFWVSLGQGQAKRCPSYGEMESWIKPYPLLTDWYHFYMDRQDCLLNQEEFFKTLAASEALSIKLNQAEVTFEQFYVPLYHVLSIENWGGLDKEEIQKIQSDLNLIDHSLKKAMGLMNAADQDYFKAVVLLDLPSEFVLEKSAKAGAVLSKRLNRPVENPARQQIDFRDIAQSPYQRVFAH